MNISEILEDLKRNGTKVISLPRPDENGNQIFVQTSVSINDNGELIVSDIDGELNLGNPDLEVNWDMLKNMSITNYKVFAYPPLVEFEADSDVPISVSYLFKDDSILAYSREPYADKFLAQFTRKKFRFRERLDNGNLSSIFIQLMEEEPTFTASLKRVVVQKEPPAIGNKREHNPVLDENGRITLDEDGIPVFEQGDITRIDVPTACVWFNIKTNRFHMYFNKDFVSHLTVAEKKDLIKHEVLHILLEHLNRVRYSKKDKDERFNLHAIANIAQDLTINSYLDKLPRGVLFRGLFEDTFNKILKSIEGETEEITNHNIEIYIAVDMAQNGIIFKSPIEEKNSKRKLATYILTTKVLPMYGCEAGVGKYRKLPKGKEAAWYYYQILTDLENNNDGEGEGDGSGSGHGTIDKHIYEEMLGDKDITAEDYQSAKESEAKRVAENFLKESKDRGLQTNSIISEIERLLDNSIPWEKELSFFIKRSIKSSHYSTFKRPNKRYFNNETGEPYSTGRKQEHTSNILVLIDQSGSVGNDIITKFFAELTELSKYAAFDLYSFDTEVLLDSKQMIRKGQNKIEFKRTQCGGTSFTAATNFSNEKVKEYDATIIMTDFYAELPPTSKLRRLWIGTEENYKNSSFPFNKLGNNEKVIVMKEKK